MPAIAACVLIAAGLVALASPHGPGLAAASPGPHHQAPGCGKPQPDSQLHTPKATSDAWLQHGVSGTVVNVTGQMIAVDTANATIVTVYQPSGRPTVVPGDSVRVTGRLIGGVVRADAVQVTGGKPWPAPTTPAQPTGQIQHVIFVIQENHSFDNYFGTYPGAIGLSPLIRLPLSRGAAPTVAPFQLTQPINHDLNHSWLAAHEAYDHGKMDDFVWADGSRDVMGYYTGQFIPNYWAYAQHFTLDDMFFSSLMGPSLPNHLYTVAGYSGGWMWNMWMPPTCGFGFASVPDQLQAAGVSWAYYSGTAPQTMWLWNPLPGFTTFEQSPALRSHLYWDEQFFQDLRDGNLPAMSWVTPSMLDSEHPPTDPRIGMWYVTDLLNAVMQSPYWNDTVVVVTWDEYGGFYDNVAPTQVDPYGFGFRVPALIISPYAAAGSINSTPYDFTSVLRYVEESHLLPPITNRIAQANSIGSELNTSQTPLGPFLITHPLSPSDVPQGVTLGPAARAAGPAPGSRDPSGRKAARGAGKGPSAKGKPGRRGARSG